ncbi:MAG: DNA alkylation repair protein [Lachnospiraceae bacterium]|nr:DNA alkylation repair protein [Lachnospiraceae bacterium]
MDAVIEKAKEGINSLLGHVPRGKHIVTGDIRKLSGGLYREIEDKTIANVLMLAEELLEQHSWAFGVIAFDWAYRLRGQYTPDTYDIFYAWLKKYVRGWGDCDDFCTHAFGELLRQYKELFVKMSGWRKDADFWVRRASAVVLIPAIMKDDYKGVNPYEVADALMYDAHDLVQKGYGWMLKCLSQVEPDAVRKYLAANSMRMPRTAFRYAMEKFDKETREKLMAL